MLKRGFACRKVAAPNEPIDLIELLMATGLVSSKSEAKHLLSGSAIELNRVKVKSRRILVKSKDILHVGKFRWIEFIG